MNPKSVYPSCPDCDGITRRELLRAAGGVAIGAAAAPLTVLVTPRPASAAAAAASEAAKRAAPETLVQTLYGSLSEAQKEVMTFTFNHPLRSRVDNNWAIVKPTIDELFSRDQRAMITEIFRGVHNEEYVDKVLQHMADDAGGIGNYHVAIFGTPGSGKFEWVLTGRHCTVRCDGDSVAGTAFGGPIFYGHAAQGFNEKPDHPGNVYWYQAKRANQVYQALDGKQRRKALVMGPIPPEEGNDTVRLSGAQAEHPGIHISELTPDQKVLVQKVMADLLLPFRPHDTAAAMKDIQENGGLDNLWLAFYQSEDIGNDGVWDVWRLEGPAMVWYFRGSPHVHTWVNVRQSA